MISKLISQKLDVTTTMLKHPANVCDSTDFQQKYNVRQKDLKGIEEFVYKGLNNSKSVIMSFCNKTLEKIGDPLTKRNDKSTKQLTEKVINLTQQRLNEIDRLWLVFFDRKSQAKDQKWDVKGYGYDIALKGLDVAVMIQIEFDRLLENGGLKERPRNIRSEHKK